MQQNVETGVVLPAPLVEALENDDASLVFQHLVQNPNDLFYKRTIENNSYQESLLGYAYTFCSPTPAKSICAIIDFVIANKSILDTHYKLYSEAKTLLSTAIQYGQEEIAIKLLDIIRNEVPSDDSSALISILTHAFQNSRFKLVKACVKAGADPNSIINGRRTLSITAYFNQDENAKKYPDTLVEIIAFNKFVGNVDKLPTQWLIELTKRLYNEITFSDSADPKEFLRLLTTLEQYEQLILSKTLSDLVQWQRQNKSNGGVSSQEQYIKLTKFIEKLKINDLKEETLSYQDFHITLQEVVAALANLQERKKRIASFYQQFDKKLSSFSSDLSNASLPIKNEGKWMSGYLPKTLHALIIKLREAHPGMTFSAQFQTYIESISLLKKAIKNKTTDRHPDTQTYYETKFEALQSLIGPTILATTLEFTEITVPNPSNIQIPLPSAPLLTTPFGTPLSPELQATALLTYSQRLNEYATNILTSTKTHRTLFPVDNPYQTTRVIEPVKIVTTINNNSFPNGSPAYFDGKPYQSQVMREVKDESKNDVQAKPETTGMLSTTVDEALAKLVVPDHPVKLDAGKDNDIKDESEPKSSEQAVLG